MGLELIQLQVGLVENFCEIIACTETGQAALVDPAFEVDRLLAVARDRGWTVTTILLTHSHLDHINGLAEAVSATGALVRCHPLECAVAESHVPKHLISALFDRERIPVGTGEVKALFTPGHTPSCVCFHLPKEAALITGDVLFIGSVGKAQDPVAMRHSLHHVIAALPDHTKIYPGHDYGDFPTGYLAYELTHNPGFR